MAHTVWDSHGHAYCAFAVVDVDVFFAVVDLVLDDDRFPGSVAPAVELAVVVIVDRSP